MSLERQPLNLTVARNAATRISGVQMPGGYQIINRDLTAIVWVAANPSVADGNGTPISPGTAIKWMNDQDIYLILGSDTESLTVTSAQITVTYDAEDWDPSPAAVAAAILNSGVLIIDRPVVIFTGTLTAGNILGPIDTSRYNSLLLSWTATNIVGNYRLMIDFLDGDGTVIGQMPFVGINPTIGGLATWSGQIPIRGSRVRITATNADFIMQATLSSRQVAGITQFPPPGIGGQYLGNLMAETNLAVGAGTAATRHSSPWYGEVDIEVKAVATLASPGLLATIDIFEPITAAIWKTVPLGNAAGIVTDEVSILPLAGSLFTSFHTRIELWGTQLGFQIFNQTGVGLTATVSVKPVRYNP